MNKNFAIIGNPNCGKTTIFNSLTGLKQKVANYPGVTVEKKEGTITFKNGSKSTLIDLPGTYSLSAFSPDEKIATDQLLNPNESKISAVLCVIDASNIERNLFLLSQIIDLNFPTIAILNMVDVAAKNGCSIDTKKLSKHLGIPVVQTIANQKLGIDELKEILQSDLKPSKNIRKWRVNEVLQKDFEEVSIFLQKNNFDFNSSFHDSIQLLSMPSDELLKNNLIKDELKNFIIKKHEKLDFLELDRTSAFIDARYDLIKQICDDSVIKKFKSLDNFSDKIDKILTHKIFGFVFFFGIMALMFQIMFSWILVPMQWIEIFFVWLSISVSNILPSGPINNLITDGVLGGVGAVVTFLPQIVFLFLFLGILEDSGYMARAAFIMDKLMGRVGLHGKSFIPLLSSFACAIPGIMATRTIDNEKDRITTILIAPLLSCSARIPVYTLMIATFIPQTKIFGFLPLPAITLTLIYMLGIFLALAFGFIFRKTLLKGSSSLFLMELPQYKFPSASTLFHIIYERAGLFLKRAGTFILAVSIVLWFLASYPKIENASPSTQLENSFAGKVGKFIEPAIKPLGFDWKIGIGLVTSVLQREVFVSTIGTIYNMNDSKNIPLSEKIRTEINVTTGEPSFTILTAICILVYYALSLQCLSTVSVVRRETNSWKWPAIQFFYMTSLAYLMTFITYRIGILFL